MPVQLLFIQLKWCSKMIMGFAYEYTYWDIIRTMNTKHIGALDTFRL